MSAEEIAGIILISGMILIVLVVVIVESADEIVEIINAIKGNNKDREGKNERS